MGPFGWAIVFILGSAVLIGVLQALYRSRTVSNASRDLAERFPEGKVYAHWDGSYIAINPVAKIIAIGRKSRSLEFGNPYEAIYDYSQIAKVELNQDGATLASTNRGSQVLGAAVGAAAFGGVGAIIGGLSGSSTSRQTIRRISLKLITDDTEHPAHDITFFTADNQKKGVDPTGIVGAEAVEGLRKAEEFHALVVGAIRLSDSAKSQAPPPPSVAAQIKDLWDLKEAGAITSEEFEQQKQGVLARSAAS